jgi:putative hydrolase of the HAD superfamily
VTNTFRNHPDHDSLVQNIFRHEKWKQLNRGELTEQDAKKFYSDYLNLKDYQIDTLFENIKTTQIPIEGTQNLLLRLFDSGYSLYALTDNVTEIINYLKIKYDFWKYFSGVVVSADVGHLKPSKEIFVYLLEKYNLNPNETVFIDDFSVNVNAAKSLGMTGILFNNADQCETDIINLRILSR